MIKLIIFDWDDVFSLGSQKGYYQCYFAALKAVGVKLSQEEAIKRIKAKWGQPVKAELEHLLQEHLELVDKAIDVFYQHRFGPTFFNQISIVKNGQKTLGSLAKKYLLALATGTDRKALNYTFTHYSVPNFFTQIICSSDLKNANQYKPHPYMINQILKTQKIKPHEAIFVGDATNDVLMAQAAKVKTIVVLTGHLTEFKAKKLGADYIIGDVNQIESLLTENTL